MDKPPAVTSGLVTHLFIRENKAAEAIDYYKKAFDAEEVHRMPTPDGRLMHAHLRINGADLFLCDEFPDMGMRPRPMGGFTVHIQVADCNAWYNRALEAGPVESSKAPEDMFWGDRYASIRDVYGVDWSIGQTL